MGVNCAKRKGTLFQGIESKEVKGGLVRGLHLVEEKEVMDVPGLAMPLVGDSKNLGRRRKEPQAHVGTSANTHTHTHPQMQNSPVASVANIPGTWGHVCGLLVDL